MRIAFLILVAALAAGCSTKFEVVSDTSWVGVVDGDSVRGDFDHRYGIPGGGPIKATFRKMTPGGILCARCYGRRGDGRWVKTSAPFDSVTVSTN